MFRRIVWIALFTAAFASVNAQYTGYSRSGMGFRMGLVLVDDPEPVDVGFNIGGHGDIAFKLGRAGELHYVPGIDVWFGGEDYRDSDLFISEIDLNIFDLRYYFPVPATVKPFVGMGPAVVMQYWHQEWNNYAYPPYEYHEESDWDSDAGFNLFTGVDFEVSRALRFYVEARGKFGDWDAFKLLGGMTFALGR